MKPFLLQTAGRSADPEADELLAALQARFPDWGRPQPRNGRGLPRELMIMAVMLEARSRGGLEAQLSRAAGAFRRAGLRPDGALRKSASHARAGLRHERGLRKAVARLDPASPDLVEQARALVARIDLASAVEARVERLSGARGGRPAHPQLKTLPAVIALLSRAQEGDRLAATEIDLIRACLSRQAA